MIPDTFLVKQAPLPAAEIALKVFVVLTTGNESGSAAMLVERPASVQLLAA